MDVDCGSWFTRRRHRGLALAAGLCSLLSTSGCAPEAAPATIDPAKMAMVEIGRSSRDDVFATLGRPVRTERSNAGERWIYEAAAQSDRRGRLVSGVGTATGVLGTFVPFVGLVGPGLSLANAATGPSPPSTAGSSLSVDFGADGLVRDCIYASGAMPTGLSGGPAAMPFGCGRAGTVPGG